MFSSCTPLNMYSVCPFDISFYCFVWNFDRVSTFFVNVYLLTLSEWDYLKVKQFSEKWGHLFVFLKLFHNLHTVNIRYWPFGFGVTNSKVNDWFKLWIILTFFQIVFSKMYIFALPYYVFVFTKKRLKGSIFPNYFFFCNFQFSSSYK